MSDRFKFADLFNQGLGPDDLYAARMRKFYRDVLEEMKRIRDKDGG